jgi:hypothetical protein
MEKIIKIGKQEVRLNNNVAWTMEYRDQFGKDIVPALMPVIASMIEGVSTIVAESGKTEISVSDIAEAVQGRAMEVLLPMFQVEFVDVVINVTWAMAKAADENIAPPKQWVKQFETFPLDVVAPAVYDLVLKGFVSSKNLKRLKKISESLKTLQPISHSTTSSSLDLSEG